MILEWLKRFFIGKGIDKRDAVRLKADRKGDIRFRPADSKADFDVHNLSFMGVGLIDNEKITSDVAVGNRIRGKLIIRQKSVVVVLEVRHRANGVIGCAIVEARDKLVPILEKHFEYEITASRMSIVDPKYLKKVNGVAPFWCTDPSGNEIFVALNDDKIDHFHVTFLGNYIEGAADGSLRVGVVNQIEKDESLEMRIKSSQVIDFLRELDPQILNFGRRFVDQVDGVPDNVRKMLLDLIKVA